MANEARMTFQPGPDVGMLVRAVVVHDEMQGDLSGTLLVQSPEKPEKLLVSMPFMALSDYPAAQKFQSREQSGGSVALVIMRHGPATALLQGQARLRTIQRLNLTLFVHAQHDCLLWWIQIQAHDVGQLFQESGIP